MSQIYEKRPGRWKISGSSKVYRTEAEAKEAGGIYKVEEPIIEEPIVEEIDPLEALKQARTQKDGSIEEGLNNDAYNEDSLEELFEGSD